MLGKLRWAVHPVVEDLAEKRKTEAGNQASKETGCGAA